MSKRWVYLSGVISALAGRGVSISVLNDAHEAIANAIRSGDVPTLGRRLEYTATADERIEKKISDSNHVDVFFSSVQSRRHEGSTKWGMVKVELGRLEEYLRENDMLSERATLTPEEELAEWLRNHNDEPVLIKDKLRADIKSGKHPLSAVCSGLSDRAFDQAWASGAPDRWKRPGKRRKLIA
ncbi:MAG TPA: hypothetical protein VIE66_20870 [Methylocella sp.]|jgi:hypothetical protein